MSEPEAIDTPVTNAATADQAPLLPNTPGTRVALVIMAVLAVAGGITTGKWLSGFVINAIWPPEAPLSLSVAIRPHTEPVEYLLMQEPAARFMEPINDPVNERWADIAGNFYSREFIAAFSYVPAPATAAELAAPTTDTPTEEAAAPEPAPETPPAGEATPAPAVPAPAAPAARFRTNGPWVRVATEPVGETLVGRLEARGLKPNFAYQIKLLGAYKRDRAAYQALGSYGRIRLPTGGTNFTTEEFNSYINQGGDPDAVEMYILFDYFVTDGNGNAVRTFQLDHSLHVLWATRQRGKDLPADQIEPFTFDANSPAIYLRPKPDPVNVELWAEREKNSYRVNDELVDVIRLPPGRYDVDLVLTEESFHSPDRDGGYWATVYRLPVQFTVVGTALPEGIAPRQ